MADLWVFHREQFEVAFRGEASGQGWGWDNFVSHDMDSVAVPLLDKHSPKSDVSELEFTTRKPKRYVVPIGYGRAFCLMLQ